MLYRNYQPADWLEFEVFAQSKTKEHLMYIKGCFSFYLYFLTGINTNRECD